MEFEFSLGGYFNDHNYTVRLAGNLLYISDQRYLSVSDSEMKVPVENNENWLQLLAFIKTCGWKRTYDNGALDGTQWELKLKDSGFKIKSYGSNAYPANFNDFLWLLNQVMSPVGVAIAR